MIALTIALAAALASPPAPCAVAASPDRVAGHWTGTFAGTDWTFDLSNGPKGWSGRYRTAQAMKWTALEEVAIDGGCATFSLKSEPRVTFALVLTPEATTMAGDVTLAGRATLPFTARREP